MTAFVPTQLGVLLPSDINDLGAAGIADGEFAKRVGGAWDGARAVENGIFSPLLHTELRVSGLNLPSSVNDFAPSIPSGYKLWTPYITIGNPTAGTISGNIVSVVRGGVPYQIVQAFNVSLANMTFFGGYAFLYPGDTLRLTAAGAGLNLGIRGFLFPDDGDLKLFSAPVVNGNNVIYTCPVGKKATVVPYNGQLITYFAMQLMNTSGGTANYYFHAVPVGDVVQDANKIGARLSVGSGVASTMLINGGIEITAGGSFVLVTTGTNPSWATLCIQELDA